MEDKIICEVGAKFRDEKASILLEKVKPYDVRTQNPVQTQFFNHKLHFLNKVSITYKNGRNVTEEKVTGIWLVTFFNKNNEEEVFVTKFNTESGLSIDLNFMYTSDVDKIIESL